MIKLWHCYNTRSLRPLWALAEMQLEHEVISLPFPPRYLDKSFLDINTLGTVPFFANGETTLTESSAILLYLVERYQQYNFGVSSDHPEYGDYLNWLFQSDATLTFPQAIVLRYSQFESLDRQSEQVSEDYKKWFLARLKRLDQHLLDREYLCAAKFTVADIAVGYALFLGEQLGLDKYYQPQTLNYLQRLKARPAFNAMKDVGKDIANYKIKPMN
ncbi:glutathione S-transferase family protein [Colwelliaceae bacterium BS250]